MKTRLSRPLLLCLLVLFELSPALGQRELGVRPLGSGGPLLPEQAAYDIKDYDLDLRINPGDQSIKGTLTAHAQIVAPTRWFVLDLDTPLTVDSVWLLDQTSNSRDQLSFERRETRLWIAFPLTRQPGDDVRVLVNYQGKPRTAPRPPWVGGFVWAKTADGQPWLGVACQNDGAKIWFLQRIILR